MTESSGAAVACAAAFVDRLRACGVRDFVLSPGSRSGPLALVLADRERGGLVGLHVRVDERSAGFLAVGLARRSGVPVAVICTSGTAAANLHPAVLEASYSPAPLIVVTADRPEEVRGRGAAQTVDQVDLYGTAVRWSVDLPAPDAADDPALHAWSGAADTAVRMARLDVGPVHVNAAFRPPLVGRVPEAEAREPEPHGVVDAGTDLAWPGPLPDRGLIVVGDLAPKDALRERIPQVAAQLGWPIIAEPTAGLRPLPGVLRHGPLLLASSGVLERNRPDLVISVGRFGISRPVLELVRSVPTHWAVKAITGSDPPDPARSACAILPGLPDASSPEPGGTEWLTDWLAADEIAARQVESLLDFEPGDSLSGPMAAIIVRQSLANDELLFVGPSWPMRFLESFAGPGRGVVMANRGVNGIDGVTSTAAGAALAHRREAAGASFALLGDLTFLHDHNGLLWPNGEAQPDLTYVVLDNDGGGIFSQLEQGDPRFADDFERLFGTAHGLDLVAVARAAGVPAERVATVAQLRASLRERTDGLRVIVASVGSRGRELQRIQRIGTAVSEATR